MNTLPEKTLQALADHGDAEQVLERFTQAGVDLDALAADLQRDGAAAFVKSWDELLALQCGEERSAQKLSDMSTKIARWRISISPWNVLSAPLVSPRARSITRVVLRALQISRAVMAATTRVEPRA